MASFNPVLQVYVTRRREALLLVPLFALVAGSVWVIAPTPWIVAWLALVLAAIPVDLAIFRKVARLSRLCLRCRVVLGVWQATFSSLFAVAPLVLLMSGQVEGFVAGLAACVAAVLRNTPDVRISYANAIAAITPHLTVGLAGAILLLFADEVAVAGLLAAVAIAGMFVFVIQHGLQRSHAEASAMALAGRDGLTGLLSRTAFLENLGELLADAKVRPLAVACIDLDELRTVNDVYGNRAGDALLVEVARRLEALPEVLLVARLGGDKFAVAFQATTDPLAIADRVLGAIRAPMTLGERAIAPSASLGVAVAAPGGVVASALVHDADAAMRRAKRSGGGVQAFDEGFDLEQRQRKRLEADIREGIARGDFIPFYQPLVELSTNRVVGWEMLMRWDHPIKGLLPPSVFIATAEQTRLIDEMFWPVLRKACLATRDLPDGPLLAVNVAVDQMHDPAFVNRLLGLLEEVGYPAGRLEIELTERGDVGDLGRIDGALRLLAEVGMRVALDDFGTGNSTLRLLRELPIHKLKVDRSFVSRLVSSAEDAKIVEAIIGLARSLNIQCTAEGIEDMETALALRFRGCQYGQGYHFGRPSAHPERQRSRPAASIVPPPRSAAA